MSIATVCPHCHSTLSSPTAACTHCGRAPYDFPTRTLDDLNTTTDFRIAQAEQGDDPWVGSQLANYRIESFLGEGGMARVYRARHLTLERPCALKVLKPSYCGRWECAAESFLAEARAAAALVHPNVVTIHTIGEDRGQQYIELEYVEGSSLNTVLNRCGPFDFTEATRLMVQIASALSLAHQSGMVHRDIKPANVLFTRDRTAKLADFGLAKQLRQLNAEDGRILTGTPNYMAPELFQGQPAGPLSDVYAMGVTYFQLLTAELPFSGNSVADLIRAHHEGPTWEAQPSCADLPDQAAAVLRRCLAVNPDDRYPAAESLLLDLRAAYGCLRSLESLLRESLQGEDVVISGQGNRFEVHVSLAHGRRQKVLVEIADSDAIAEQVVRIASVCGAADERHFLRALQLNPQFAYGAIGIEAIDGVAHFVMTNVYPRATCDPEEIRHSVMGIAQHADDAERWLSHDDVH